MPAPMQIVRLLVAWLLLAALPLQGLAAATMLFCDQAAAGAARASAHEGPSAHDHGHRPVAAHGGHEEHGAHAAHAAHAGHEAHAAQDAQDADAAHDGPQAQASNGADAQHADAPADGGHKCPICAACQLVALPESAPVLAGLDALPADLPQPRVPVLTRAPPLPDKPPRA